mmetsp:Transcript_14219/g.35225  ORF Transcript_14219/g.35225 Transcript_14219/m.35225 type:complete len:229 (+) Transcript_14219:130-816(+)
MMRPTACPRPRFSVSEARFVLLRPATAAPPRPPPYLVNRAHRLDRVPLGARHLQGGAVPVHVRLFQHNFGVHRRRVRQAWKEKVRGAASAEPRGAPSPPAFLPTRDNHSSSLFVRKVYSFTDPAATHSKQATAVSHGDVSLNGRMHHNRLSTRARSLLTTPRPEDLPRVLVVNWARPCHSASRSTAVCAAATATTVRGFRLLSKNPRIRASPSTTGRTPKARQAALCL